MYTASGYVSNHYFGRAMDIAAVDGVSCTDTAVDAPCANLARTLAYLPAPVHPTELIYCFDVDGPGPGLRPAATTAITSTPAYDGWDLGRPRAPVPLA